MAGWDGGSLQPVTHGLSQLRRPVELRKVLPSQSAADEVSPQSFSWQEMVGEHGLMVG